MHNEALRKQIVMDKRSAINIQKKVYSDTLCYNLLKLNLGNNFKILNIYKISFILLRTSRITFLTNFPRMTCLSLITILLKPSLVFITSRIYAKTRHGSFCHKKIYMGKFRL